jgi:hypothetical protein
VLLALVCMHSHNIVHCDIKPENVLVADDDTPRICDFEMSKDLGALSSTMGGGTVLFMAPEVLTRKAKPSPASDMYAFGLLVLNAVCELGPGDTYPLTDASKVADPALRELIRRLLSDRPASRPSAIQLQAEPYFADDGVKEARETEQREITLREADLALEQGVRWVCEGTPYSAENSRVLEQVFQRLRLFPADAHAGSVAEIHMRRVDYRVDVSVDGGGMMQCRPGSRKQRPVRREEPLLAPLRAVTQELARGCDAWARIEARVQESLPTHVVTSLKQIDNNQLMSDFDRQMEIVAAKPTNAARGGTVEHRANVRFGFHAMAGKPTELKKIYEGGRADGGFDYRIARGGAYGRGSYFAEHAIYSAYLYPCPTKATDGSIVLLVAEVILGQSKDLDQLCSRDLQPWDPLGKARICDLVREPPIEGGAAGDVYDSIQGTEGSFGIHGPPGLHHPRQDAKKYGRNPQGEEEYGRQYIVYDKAKAYPRYLVTIRPK